MQCLLQVLLRMHILILPTHSRIIGHQCNPKEYRAHRKSKNTTTKNYTGLEEKNKALVLKAFDTLFNNRDYVTAEGYWSPKYIQHSAVVPPGRDGLFNLVKNSPSTLKYEPGIIVADGDFVIVQDDFRAWASL